METPELESRIRIAFPTMIDSDFGYHATDLHVRACHGVYDWLKENYKHASNVTSFISQIDGGLWYDIPFAGRWPD